ncbi:MAG: HAMP domain-containing sensor histidine kinase [Symbiobacterium sp.]|uniref:sensor histidine kinase n=1 Tax=Symbiobacterium sp. TaxID=1971213 RepID=UPI003463875E
MSLRLRLALLYTAQLTAALVIFSFLLYWVFRWSYVNQVDANLRSVAWDVAKGAPLTWNLPTLRSLAGRSTFILVRSTQGVVTQSSDFGTFPLPAEARAGKATLTFERDAYGEPYRLYSLPVYVGDTPTYWIQVAQPLQLLEQVLRRLRPLLTAAAVAFALITGAVSWLLAGRAMRPIQRVAEAAEAIGESADLGLRVPYKGPQDEVGRLVHTFNGMLDQLQDLYGRLGAAVDAQKRFVADASHELRTPLTIIRGNIDYLERAGTLDPEALADMKSEAARMSQLLEELLAMARADAGQKPELEPLALGLLVRDVCNKAQALPHQVEFRLELPEALDRVMVLGHAEWLRRALLILLDNAFKYTSSGSVTVRAGRQGDGVVLQVIDTGQGIAPEDLPRIFDRFYRADRARSRGGTGLGLAIASWVAGMHGGRLTAESKLREGSTFSLWLPVYRPGEQRPNS